MSFRFHSFARTVFTLLLSVGLTAAHAHSGKARFHIVVDTDGAADDLRTLCLLLGNREAEVLAVTTSEGALLPDSAAVRVRALLDSFYHEGIPVGAGRAVQAPVPAWRAHSLRVAWGDAAAGDLPAAGELLAQTLADEEEQVVVVALGALTNLSDLLRERPDLGRRIERIVWYNDSAAPLSGANYATDSTAAHRVLASGVPVTVVTACSSCPMVITPALLDSVAAVPTPYARKIVATHRAAPLAELVAAGHLRAWDDLTAVWLFAPELFTVHRLSATVDACRLADERAVRRAQAQLTAILRGKPDNESRVFYGFPIARDLYAADVAPLVDSVIVRHGSSEWRAGVLTNELHGHLGIYATIGVKMGIRAREYFNIGVDDIRVVTFAGSRPPVSCMNDGLQVGTGASVGHGLIDVASVDAPRPEARFTFKNKTIRLALKPAYADRIRRDVQRGVELHGDLTEPYWQYVRALALRYWLDFDRHEIFDLTVGE